jgi:phosphoenolpyruvate synthase/pyruvate phosphate dikinase
MVESYDAIAAAASDSARQKRLVSDFLTRLRSWILSADPGPDFRGQLGTMLAQTFGSEGELGVFVRSDTNVEDLEGFTGAGLNLTVPNVVGYDDILQAIREVWASPFTERAYGWRQSHMGDPEYVFPAVVIQAALPSEKSGVMVTVDVETGESGWLTVAVSEGPGGGVEGQSAESLRISARTGAAQFLAQATEPTKPVLLPTGGVARVPASGAARLLSDDEIQQLVTFANSAHENFESLQGEKGEPLPADIEFGFVGGRLSLLQIRPFVESGRAQHSAFLNSLDAGLRERGETPVPLDGIPGRPAPEIRGEAS